MNELIGRRGGGGGGHGHGHHGGHVHRFHFGAPAGEYDGYGWGPVYSWPWAEEYVENVDEGDVQDYVGADWRRILTAMTPNANVTYDLSMKPGNVLHVTVRTDGRTYQAERDISELINGAPGGIGLGGPMIATTVSGHHHRHSQAQGPQGMPDLDQEIESAGMIVVGQLLDQHCRTVTAGWWDDVTSSASSVGDAIQSTVRTFKGPLSEVAGNMAASYASAYGGPAAGMIAKNLAGSLVNAAAGDDHAAGNAAKQAIEQAKAAAINNPNVAAALDSARKAVAQMTGAYHIASTADQATSGEPRAVLAINQLHAAAGAGDASARRGLQIAQEVRRVATSSPPTSRATYVPAASYLRRRSAKPAYRRAPRPTTAAQVNLARAAIERLRTEARAAVLDANLQHGDTVLGFSRYAVGSQVQAFNSSDDADDWLRDLDPGELIYAAYYDQGDPTWPTPLNELFGTVVQGTDRDGAVSGALPLIPFLFGAAAGGAGYAWWHHHHHHASPAAQATTAPGATPVVTSGPGAVDPPTIDSLIASIHDLDREIQHTDLQIAVQLSRPEFMRGKPSGLPGGFPFNQSDYLLAANVVNHQWRPFVAHWNQIMRETHDFESGNRSTPPNIMMFRAAQERYYALRNDDPGSGASQLIYYFHLDAPNFPGFPYPIDPLLSRKASLVHDRDLDAWRDLPTMVQGAVTTSGEVDGARADAIVAAQELHRQNGATYVGYAKTRGGGTSDRGDGVVVTVEDTAMVQSFPTFDALSRWFNQASEQEDYLYLACFDASSQAWPAPIGSIAAPARTTSASRGAWTASRR